MKGKIADYIPRPGALNSLARVREEMGRVYRDMRTGRIQMADGTRLFYSLNILMRAIESGDLERRLETLEKVSLTRVSACHETSTSTY